MSIQGTYQASGRGFGFFTPEGAVGREADLFIPPRDEGSAWSGDTVIVETRPDARTTGRMLARVTAVVARNNHIVVGVVERCRNREVWLTPSSDRLPFRIKLVGRTGGIRTGDRVAAAMQSFGSRSAPPLGTLKQVFGRDGTRSASVESILYQYHIQREFPAPVRAAAELAPEAVEPAALAGRLDLRGQTVITIDGAASKDFDDAVSLTRDDRGRWVLGVHIADVSHYVKDGSPLDLEAWERGTSVYFADQVIPMLPEALSNGICSLNPQVDRLALSCIMTMDDKGNLLEHTIAKTVIRSAERMTYADCNLLLEGRCPDLEARYAAILPMLRDMAALAGHLEKARRSRGALELESRECCILCDEAGEPVEVLTRESGVSEKLIESFMLAANECVARHLCDGGLPAVYRVHEKPSEDKVNTLRAMLAPLGYDLRQADHGSLQKVLDQARGTPQAPAIHTMVLRSMQKARYDVENLGHFGLAAEYYCHFTSPIRRYPDLMVHRILSAMLEGKVGRRLEAKAKAAAVQSSDREVAAMNAEREIEKCYLAQFMLPYVGQRFSGAVSGVTRFGLFVTLANGVEGLVPVSDLPEDQYEYDEVRMTLTGARTGGIYSFGMPLEVVCAGAHPGTGQIDFTLPETAERPRTQTRAPEPAPRSRTKTASKGRPGRPAYRPPKRSKGRRRGR